MKKYLFWLATLVAAFFLGLGAFVLYYSSFIPEIAKPEILSTQKKFDCIKSYGFPGFSKKISELNKGKSGYFPEKIFGNDMSPKHSVAGWYGKHLKAMSEKSLLDISDENTKVYRFLWLRTFHHPIFVRIERNRNEVKLFTNELDGAGGYEPGKVLRTNSRNLTEEEWCGLLRLFDKANYWKLPSNNEDLGNDGAQWILEAVEDNRYHIVERWSPQEGEYREACIYLLKLSGIDVDKLKDDLY